jgi:hypothetical protein
MSRHVSASHLDCSKPQLRTTKRQLALPWILGYSKLKLLVPKRRFYVIVKIVPYSSGCRKFGRARLEMPLYLQVCMTLDCL